MPDLIVYPDAQGNGRCAVPAFAVGDDRNWTLKFSDGVNFYNPAGVTMSLGYVKGLGNATYASGFQLVDRMNNQHTGSFIISSAVPGTLTWDENPISVNGDFGAWLIKGRVPPSSWIRKVYVKFGGTGITTAPIVRFNGGASSTGKAATATVSVSAGVVTNSFVITNGGIGYSATTPPEVIVTGDGTGATATATVVNGVVSAITLVRAGSGFTSATVTIRDPEATATATVGGTSGVTGATVSNPGMGYTSAPTIAFSGGGGTLAAATAALLNSTWGVSGMTITAAGTLYTLAPAVSFSGGTGSGVAGYAEISPYGVITAVTLTSPGNGRFDAVPRDVTFTGGGGSGATGKTILQSNAFGYYDIVGILMVTGGSGYSSTPTVVIDQGTGSGATGTAIVGTGAVTNLVITNAGSGYGATAPTVTIAGPGGGGVTATATAQLIGSPISPVITIGTAGSGYTSPPTMAFSGGAGSGAAAAALVSLGVTAITMVQTGFAYTSLPSVSLVPDNGAVLIPAGVESHSIPFVQNFNPSPAQGAITATPMTSGRRDTSGNLIYDDALLIIRPRYLLQPTLTLQADGLTWAGVFNPVVTFVNALLAFQSVVVVDVEIFGGGRLLLQTKLPIIKV